MKNVLIISLKNPVRKNKVGGQQDILGRILALNKLGYQVDIIAIDNNDQLQNDTQLPNGVNLFLFKKKFAMNKLIKYPIATATRFQEEIVEFLSNKEYDISICESEFLYVYWQHGFVKSKRSFLRMHNIESEYYKGLGNSEKNLVKRILYKFDAYRLLKMEKKGFVEFEKLMFISSNEYNQMNISTERKCILPAIFPIYDKDIQNKEINRNKNGMLIFGDFTLDINKSGLNWFIKYVWPIIISRKEDVKLTVVGKGSNSFDSTLNINTLGYVDDLKGLFNSFQIVVIPLLEGAGVKIKLVESLLMRKTIITTQKGIEGTELINGQHLYVSEDYTTFAENCILALEQIDESINIAENGFNYARGIFTVDGHAKYLEEIFN